MPKRKRPHLDDHPTLDFGGDFGSPPEPARYEPPPPPPRPPWWKQVLALLLRLLRAVRGWTLGGLRWLFRQVWDALVRLLAAVLARGVLLVLALVLAILGVKIVPASYWPWWFRKVPALERLKPPPDLPPESWRMETTEELPP